MVEKRFRERTPLLKVNVFSSSELQFFRGRMDKLTVEGTSSEDFLKVLARIPLLCRAGECPHSKAVDDAYEGCASEIQ